MNMDEAFLRASGVEITSAKHSNGNESKTHQAIFT